MFRFFVIVAVVALLVSSASWHSLVDSENYEKLQALEFVRAVQSDKTLLDGIVSRAITNRDIYWLQQAALQGHKTALYELSLLTESDKQRLKWLTLAAEAGIAAAQFELSLLPSHAGQRLSLLQTSAEQAYPAAQHALANWFLFNENEDAAIEWLQKSGLDYPQDAFALATIYWRNNHPQRAENWYRIAAEQQHKDAQRFLNVLTHEKPISLAKANQVEDVFTHTDKDSWLNCAKNILPISLSLGNQVQAQQFVEKLNTDARLEGIPMCFSKPIWLDNHGSLCEQRNLAGRSRTVCDVTKLESLIRNNNVTHIILLIPEGRAYVDAGVMYLSLSASYSLFVHELAHFAGFADEYPINKELAAIHCTEKSAPNLLFDGELAYAPNDRLNHWRTIAGISEHSTDVSIYSARTCNNAGVNAYKITDQRTFMEFHDTDNIPLEYRAIWQQQVIHKVHWYPVAINLARHYESQNAIAVGASWRAFAAQQRELN